MGLGGQLISGFGWANGFGLFLPPLPTVNITILFGKKPLDICNLGVYNSPHGFVEAYTYI